MNHIFLLTFSGIVAGAIAAISGFGIGSILTPLLALWIGTKLAVAVVSIPHFIGTALRFVVIRKHVDRHVLWSFGITSAAGGLAGAHPAYLAAQRDARICAGGAAGVRGNHRHHGIGFANAIWQTLRLDRRRALGRCSADWSATRAEFARRRCLDSICNETRSSPRRPPSRCWSMYFVCQFMRHAIPFHPIAMAFGRDGDGRSRDRDCFRQVDAAAHSEEGVSAVVACIILGLGIWMLVHLGS